MIEEVFPPGQPTVERAGPLLPALDTNTMLYLSHSSENRSTTALKEGSETMTRQYVLTHTHVDTYSNTVCTVYMTHTHPLLVQCEDSP